VVALGGNADASASEAFEERLGQAMDGGKRYVIVDLMGAQLIDSRIIGVLMAAVGRLESSSGLLAVACADSNLLRLFSITGIDRAFPIHPTLERALVMR